MKRLIAYFACATLVATGGYAYRKMAKADLLSAAQTTELRLSRFQESNESQAVGEITENVVASDGRHLSKRAKEVLGKLQGKSEHQASNLKTQNVRPLSDPTPVTGPFFCNFETEEVLESNWFTIDGNGDGATWYWDDYYAGSGSACMWYTLYEALDDYLVTISPVSLEAGDAYISFDYGGFGSYFQESFEVVYGTSSDVGQMSQIISYDNFYGGVANNAIVPFTVPSDGDYYFAFHATSDPDQYGLWIDNVQIGTGAYKGIPDIVVTSVTLPSPGVSLGSETIYATVYNQGSVDIASYSLSCVVECNGSSQTSSLQTVATPLAIGESATVELAMPVDMSAEGVYTVTVTASDVTADGDGYEETDTSNNSATATTTHFGVTDVPFDVDFSTGEQNDKWASDGSWAYDGDYYYSMYCQGTGALKSQGVNLEGGKSYRVTYSYMTGYTLWGIYTVTEDFDVLCGKADEDMAVIQSVTSSNTDYSFVSGEVTYTCSESGVYQFGFSQDYASGTFYIQSVQISEVSDYDLAISGFSAQPTMLPLPQAVAVSTDVTVVNRGNQSCTGLLTISAGGSTLATVDVPEIASGATAIVPVEYSLSSFAAGSEVNVEAYVSITGQADAYETDNSASFSMTITEDELAYDQMTDDKYSGSYCIGVSGGSFVAAIPIHLDVDDVLTGISVGWGDADGQTIQLEVYKYDPDDYVTSSGIIYYNLGNQILSTTAEQGTENGQIRYSTNPRALEAGDYMICVGCTGYCLVVDAVTPGYLYLISSGYAIDQSSTGLGTAAIRAIFGEGTAAAYDLTVNGITSPDGSGLYSSNQTIEVSVTNNGYETAEGTLEVTVNGEALESQPVSLAAYTTGTYTFTADMSTPGDYIIVATATLTGDENPDDNSVEKTVTSIESLDPYVMDFEGCEDFSVDGFNPAWTTVDGDGAYVYTLDGYLEACSFMVFNPYTYSNSFFTYYPYAVPCSGEKYGVSFASFNPPNDDWLISPLLTMPESGSSLTMQVQSISDLFGLELYEVCVSTTDNDPSSFTVVASGEAPAEEWGEVTVDLSAYDGQDIYVAIHCVSNDAWLFLVDDIVITKPSTSSGISGNLGCDAGLVLYPNPVSEIMVISAEGQQIENVTIYSMSGALAGMVKSATGEVRYDVSGLAQGVYFAKVKTENGTQVMKFVKK